MDDIRIDRLLAGEDNIEPSREFAAAVMAAVRSEAAAGDDLLRFPWRLAWPGLAGMGLCLAALVVSLFLPAAGPVLYAPGPDMAEQLLAGVVDLATSTTSVWVAVACVLALLTVQLSMQFIQRASH
jgi:hypothetical protein